MKKREELDGSYIEKQLFGGILHLTAWIRYASPAYRDYDWSLCFQDSDKCSATHILSVDPLLTPAQGEDDAALALTALHFPCGEGVVRVIGRKRKHAAHLVSSADPVRGIKTVDKNGDSVTIRF